jgi:hypothetical protein
VKDIKIGATGWGSVVPKTTVNRLGDVTVNVNSRGGVEVICKPGHRDYRGWYAEAPTGENTETGPAVIADSGRTTKHLFRVVIDASGTVRVKRAEGSIIHVLGFDLTRRPDYRGETTRQLEEARKDFLRNS